MKHLLLFCLVLLNFKVSSQDYYEKVARFRKSFYGAFFQTDLTRDNYIYKFIYSSGFAVSTGDSLEKPKNVELRGWIYFKERYVEAKAKFKKGKLPENAVAEKKYYMFSINKEHYGNIDTSENDEFTEAYEILYDSLARAFHMSAAGNTANHLFIYSAAKRNGKHRYYVGSAKNTARVKIKIRRKHRRFMKERDVSVQELEMWAVKDLFGQYCDDDYYVCYSLAEMDELK